MIFAPQLRVLSAKTAWGVLACVLSLQSLVCAQTVAPTEYPQTTHLEGHLAADQLSTEGSGSSSSQDPRLMPTLAESLAATSDFVTFTEALKVSGIVEQLRSVGPYTVLAPTDLAFSEVDSETRGKLFSNTLALQTFVKSHIVLGRVPTQDLLKLKSVATLSGERRVFSKSLASAKLQEPEQEGPQQRMVVDGATFVRTDIPASNGLIHIVDKVLPSKVLTELLPPQKQSQ